MYRKRKTRQGLAKKNRATIIDDGDDNTSSSSFNVAKGDTIAHGNRHSARPSQTQQGDTSTFGCDGGNALSKRSKECSAALPETPNVSHRLPLDQARSTSYRNTQTNNIQQQPDPTPLATLPATSFDNIMDGRPTNLHDLPTILPADTQASTGGMILHSASTEERTESNCNGASMQRRISGPTGQLDIQRASPTSPKLQETASTGIELTPQHSVTLFEHIPQRNASGTGPVGQKVTGTESLLTVSMRKRGKKRKQVDSSSGELPPPTSRDQSSFRYVRLLLRLGLLPVASLVDSFWLSTLHKFVSKHLLQGSYSVGDASDPFKDLRLPTPDRPIPRSTKDLDDHPDVFNRYKCILTPVRNDIVATAKAAMLTMARLCFGDPEQHEKQFARFDALECCRLLRPRALLYSSQTLLSTMHGETQGKLLHDKFSSHFTQRAELGLALLTILFSGMLAVFRASWDQSRAKSLHRYGTKILSDRLVQRAFQASGPPSWSRPWVRALLFSCPFEEGLEETDEDKTIQNIGMNLETVCLFQLAAVMHMEQNKVTNYRKENLQDGPFTFESVDKGMAMQAIFSGVDPSPPKLHEQNGTTVQYTMKSGAYPWNKVIRWEGNLKPVYKSIAAANGTTKKVQASRYEEIQGIISHERETMQRFAKRIPLQIIRDAKDKDGNINLVDIIADLIVEKGKEIFDSDILALPINDSEAASSGSNPQNLDAAASRLNEPSIMSDSDA
mmetsp:Transcript_19713/g.33797  ORF Transcript_19713/g.33797 Transcript_19713/m.33797 type:complete len:730 (+) Transcript_19713:52-2241(+)|eukprot:CAMPEP_0184701478 /NCGR_PEP_ID=MMETSP0313-20130426/20079_1 /TAXON_ID=2792 /ORGANISM="Porphyridium aerugineum, Strain SAG 1380-2" /LENGTH=729 /DNA_ID=CAMNT_0027161555 /DNA_START=32 /DNA_END=2221 /DNA_ORIENTATION=+